MDIEERLSQMRQEEEEEEATEREQLKEMISGFADWTLVVLASVAEPDCELWAFNVLRIPKLREQGG